MNSGINYLSPNWCRISSVNSSVTYASNAPHNAHRPIPSGHHLGVAEKTFVHLPHQKLRREWLEAFRYSNTFQKVLFNKEPHRMISSPESAF